MNSMSKLARPFAAVFLLAVAACALRPQSASEEPVFLGDFRLGFNVVVVRDAFQGPGSADVDDAVLQSAIEDAVLNRLGDYNGNGLYHLGVRVDAYVLSPPGSGRESALLMAVNVWDEATKRKLSVTPIEVAATVPAGASDLEALAARAAIGLEAALRDNAGEWFVPKPNSPRIPFDRDTQQSMAAPATN